ncbi:hypothetical protein CEXT_181631 [Caerostris extrusa]|uniref:Uncharacterized protein n=1 Tax=Caerostris extrusa TaxID=172846 RepID=A0AAV4WSQ5_CAEEX|nr:hypothetical protein CEXT_181631 [Caerostris extrusa]
MASLMSKTKNVEEDNRLKSNCLGVCSSISKFLTLEKHFGLKKVKNKKILQTSGLLTFFIYDRDNAVLFRRSRRTGDDARIHCGGDGLPQQYPAACGEEVLRHLGLRAGVEHPAVLQPRVPEVAVDVVPGQAGDHEGGARLDCGRDGAHLGLRGGQDVHVDAAVADEAPVGHLARESSLRMMGW